MAMAVSRAVELVGGGVGVVARRVVCAHGSAFGRSRATGGTLLATRTKATVIDGAGMAKEIKKGLRREIDLLAKDFSRRPALAVVRVGDDAASEIYVRSKLRAAARLGIEDKEYHISGTRATQETVADTIGHLNADPYVDGIILQLPLPKHLNKRTLIQLIDHTKDVDGLHACNVGNLISACEPAFYPCTPSGIMHALRRTLDPDSSTRHFLAGRHCVMVGASSIVGKPLALQLLDAGGTVTVATAHTTDLKQHVRRADVLIVATGKPLLIPGTWVKRASTVVDVGCHPTPDGLIGEVQLDAWDAAAHMTPVPKGVGPLTVAFLLRNTVTAWERHCLHRTAPHADE